MRNHCGIFMASSLLLTACQHPVTDQAMANTVEPVYVSAYCGGSQRTHTGNIQYITDSQTLHDAIKTVSRMLQPAPVVAEVDFNRYAVVWLTQGIKPTGGYALQVVPDNAARIRNRVLSLFVQWKEPAQGRLLTQVISSPCLFLRIPRQGYDNIQVIDQNNRIRLQYSIASTR